MVPVLTLLRLTLSYNYLGRYFHARRCSKAARVSFIQRSSLGESGISYRAVELKAIFHPGIGSSPVIPCLGGISVSLIDSCSRLHFDYMVSSRGLQSPRCSLLGFHSAVFEES